LFFLFKHLAFIFRLAFIAMNIPELQVRFRATFGYLPTFVARAPGRVNLVGEHTDYNDGFVLPMAIDRDVTFVGAIRNDDTVRIDSANFDAISAFSLDDISRDESNEWSNYTRGVADILQKAEHKLNGFDAVMWGDVPIASGLSSSAATEMATIMAFEAVATPALHIDRVCAAKFAQQAEIQFVGVNCGIMDQFISSLGKRGHALLIDCRSLEHQLVPMPVGATVLVVDTKAPRTLAGSAYNMRRAECEEGARLLNAKSLRDISVDQFAINKSSLPALIAQRCEHVIGENQRVLDAVKAMRSGDLVELGALMNQSHDSLRDLYQVSSFELDTVVNIARDVQGVYGARMTGAGFGGCAIALVENESVAVLTEAITRDYPRLTKRQPNIYPCVASDGASWKSMQ
jgi:galactokinase